ncbi:PspC domain-containing protein [Pseudonocardia sp. RS010]|uniref:PspC domain-containing protein n=1 Tax=Pseudonocardia sp. RS010 TaxID=3385979 RepID=UPI0039A37310
MTRPDFPPPSVSPPVGRGETRRLRRSRRDRVFGGVCGGVARYLDVDPVLLRIAAVALALSGGFGVLAYVVAWIVVPEADEDEPDTAPATGDRYTVAIAWGAVLIGLGALLLARQWMPWFGAEVFWPLVVVAVGIVVLVSGHRGRS